MIGKQNNSRSKDTDGENTNWEETGYGRTGIRKHLIYQLFILGELMERPVHGYKLREILSNVSGPYRQMSWGAVYPLIRQLERNGLIALEEESEQSQLAGNRQPKRYCITAPGKERFYVLMNEHEHYAVETPDYFLIKLINFIHITREMQLSILKHYLGYLHTIMHHNQGKRRFIASTTYTTQDEQEQISRTIDYRESSVLGEMRWIEGEIARITGGGTSSL